MKRLISLLAAVAAAALLASCSKFSIETVLPDGTTIKASHINLLQDRKMTGKTAEGFEFTSEVNNDAPTVIFNNAVDKAAPIARAAAGA